MGRSGVGILAAAAGAGTFAAIAFTGRFLARTRLTTAVVTSLACCALPLGLIGAIAKPVPAAVLIALWGAAMCLADAAIETLRTRVIAARTVLRTVGLIEGLKLLLEGLGALLAIGLISLLGVRDMLLALGAAVPVLAVVHIPLLRRVDARASARVRLVELVRGIGVFGRLRVVALERLAAALEPEEYDGGTTILRQGEADSRGILLIDSGSVEVEVDGQPVRRLGPGASFGEIALVHDVPRTATVRSLEQVSLWALDRDHAASALTGYWRSAPRGSDTKPHAQGAAVHALLAVPALGVIPRGTLERLTSEAERLEFDAGEIVVRVGDPGEHIYVVLEGTAEATATGSTPTFMGPGEVFGQIAVLSGVPRTATVRARSRLVLLAIDGRGLATPAPAPEPPRPRRS
jgi:CRP-like cAMP-binding protein